MLDTLHDVFGFRTFRPLQEEIVSAALEGKDSFALLPTGGGKSLCYQLPAVHRPGLTVVVSPLISLMKDQVDALQALGVAATYLNSTLDASESRSRLRGLHTNRYRLLYVAPERLMLSGFLEDLKKWGPQLIAIDEAHCISEWGHDFRPEYRKLSELRDHFPGVPLMALTATATGRVREDVVKQLRLRDPGIYVASFNRPNLTYRVTPKSDAYGQVLAHARSRKRECGIVYCQSRKSAESVARRLVEDGVKARPYHAGLEPAERGRNQELFLRDEVHVICATIAFGMGINKPNVRYVLHYDLPKNIEGYYQETGRAGRDGLPSECLLLFSPGDVVKQTQFIEDKTDPNEQRIAREQLQQMVHYAEASGCRRRTLLRYFGEEWPEEACGACDNCLEPRETHDGTTEALKFLSCVARIRQANGFGVGLGYIGEVLTGGRSAKIVKWGHDSLSTFGIGTDLSRADWQAVGRELIRLGLLRQSAERFSVLEITPDGMQAMRERRKITLTRRREPTTSSRSHQAGEIPCDEALFERLRALRRRLADERDVPAYIIFSDVALREMARRYPTSEAEFSRIPGVGHQKLSDFGEFFLEEIGGYLRSNPRQMFEDSMENLMPERPRMERAPKARRSLGESPRETLARFRAGETPAEIARSRGLVLGTIEGHLAEVIAAGEQLDIEKLVAAEELQALEAAWKELGGSASPGQLRERLGEAVGYGPIRLFCAAKNRPAAS